MLQPVMRVQPPMTAGSTPSFMSPPVTYGHRRLPLSPAGMTPAAPDCMQTQLYRAGQAAQKQLPPVVQEHAPSSTLLPRRVVQKRRTLAMPPLEAGLLGPPGLKQPQQTRQSGTGAATGAGVGTGADAGVCKPVAKPSTPPRSGAVPVDVPAPDTGATTHLELPARMAAAKETTSPGSGKRRAKSRKAAAAAATAATTAVARKKRGMPSPSPKPSPSAHQPLRASGTGSSCHLPGCPMPPAATASPPQAVAHTMTVTGPLYDGTNTRVNVQHEQAAEMSWGSKNKRSKVAAGDGRCKPTQQVQQQSQQKRKQEQAGAAGCGWRGWGEGEADLTNQTQSEALGTAAAKEGGGGASAAAAGGSAHAPSAGAPLLPPPESPASLHRRWKAVTLKLLSVMDRVKLTGDSRHWQSMSEQEYRVSGKGMW
mmetsp:Transcript_32603/g.71999  ORF Transcript_32603/g.71999 Transcript_32603/m.71999 type:complete len:424 (-) Transcript_32603:968-2239(-)